MTKKFERHWSGSAAAVFEDLMGVSETDQNILNGEWAFGFRLHKKDQSSRALSNKAESAVVEGTKFSPDLIHASRALLKAGVKASALAKFFHQTLGWDRNETYRKLSEEV